MDVLINSVKSFGHNRSSPNFFFDSSVVNFCSPPLLTCKIYRVVKGFFFFFGLKNYQLPNLKHLHKLEILLSNLGEPILGPR